MLIRLKFALILMEILPCQKMVFSLLLVIPFQHLRKNLKTSLVNHIQVLSSSPQTAFIDVSLTQLRPVSITVLGEANTPGPHLVNGFATVLNALYAAGGIKTSGSLRNISVYRNNKLLKTVDVYNYITAGAQMKMFVL